ncbi:hypothetical protein HPB50_019024 [Hyalomma asiaticum]|uniref:Uncharacterized protein n=1 Tax=Hyalomma asiaticum TaxID=266040 RepID=A0ACB7T1U8_HYAAI|nr:hypothetical protein HPB50_019024 [Hyalomma asiaticum]
MAARNGEGGAVGGLSLSNLCDRMIETDTQIAVACDPYRPKGRMPGLPAGFTASACEEDPAAVVLVRRPPFDLCPVMISKHVSRCTLRRTSPWTRHSGRFWRWCRGRALHTSSWPVTSTPSTERGSQGGDERGAQVMEFAAAAGLLVKNDPHWIGLTLATTSVLTSGYTWTVRSDVTHSEHKNIAVRIGPDDEGGARKCLTRYAQELLRALEREPFFARVVRSQPLDARGNSWWTPALAQERKRVNAMRRRFQRAKSDDLRALLRMDYSAALARFRLRVAEAKASYERECHAACSRGNVFSSSYREAVGRNRPPRFLPPLNGGRFDDRDTPRTQIAVDDPSNDLPEHAEARQMTARPTTPPTRMFRDWGDATAFVAGPDAITPILVKGLFKYNASARIFPSLLAPRQNIFIPKPGRQPELTTSYRPICVNSVLGKVLERLLNGRLYHFLCRHGTSMTGRLHAR